MQFFWDVEQHVLLVSCRRFGTTYRSHLQGSSRTMVVRITILRCVKSQKIADLPSYLITHFQQSQFFSWWKTHTVVNEEIKSLKQTSNTDSNTGNSWICAKPGNSRDLTTVQPPKDVNTTHGIPFTCQYTVPVANRYYILSNNQESQESNDRILSSNNEQASSFMPDNNYEHVEGH